MTLHNEQKYEGSWQEACVMATKRAEAAEASLAEARRELGQMQQKYFDAADTVSSIDAQILSAYPHMVSVGKILEDLAAAQAEKARLREGLQALVDGIAVTMLAREIVKLGDRPALVEIQRLCRETAPLLHPPSAEKESK